jgi:hypothetical protein
VLARAREMLRLLEGGHLVPEASARAAAGDAGQLGLFTATPDPVVERLRRTDAERMTPVEALQLLDALAREARERP